MYISNFLTLQCHMFYLFIIIISYIIINNNVSDLCVKYNTQYHYSSIDFLSFHKLYTWFPRLFKTFVPKRLLWVKNVINLTHEFLHYNFQEKKCSFIYPSQVDIQK